MTGNSSHIGMVGDQISGPSLVLFLDILKDVHKTAERLDKQEQCFGNGEPTASSK